MKARKSSAIQPQMFQFVDMDELVPKKHILRQLNEALDFSVVHDWVAPLYTERTGRPAADPERMVRLMLLSYLFNHSERELYQLLSMHAGYLWFCGLDFESVQRPSPNRPSLPDRTTLVKTRKLWRKHGIFEQMMIHVVDQCIAAGLVKPDVHAGVDGSQVRANASVHSLQEITLAPVHSIEEYLSELARQDQDEMPVDPKKEDSDPPPSSSVRSASETTRLQEEAVHEDFHGKKFSNATHRSVTDPDARLYKKSKGQEAYLRYLVHNVVDVTSGVILSTQASLAAGTAEREISLRQLTALRFQHPTIRIRTVSADKAYGTPEYLGALFAQGMIPLVSLRNLELEPIPTWKRQTHEAEKQQKREVKVQEVLIKNKAKRIQLEGKYRQIQKRRTRCEHAFAEAKTVHGLDRARSRGLENMQEQTLLTAIVQNLKRLCRFKKKRPQTGSLACQNPESVIREETLTSAISRLCSAIFSCIRPFHTVNRHFSPDF
ncbi:transposase [Effusibacillus dendaii]|uniref:Transposase n=1 Tax=Effusibacillus dendaii TaxID=2743772 RepID=A0A7I8DG64_9BACL|nr:hypothetical protein skT53_29440 [Effusibacillus dendaii]